MAFGAPIFSGPTTPMRVLGVVGWVGRGGLGPTPGVCAGGDNFGYTLTLGENRWEEPFGRASARCLEDWVPLPTRSVESFFFSWGGISFG